MQTHHQVDEQSQRFTIILNGSTPNIGTLMNAIGHMTAGLVGKVAKENDFVFTDYVDADGAVHPAISHFPVIVLKAKNSSQIHILRQTAITEGLPFVDFTESMTIGTTQQQLELTQQTRTEDLNYLGIAFFGNTEKLKALTKKFSLFR